MKQKKIFIYVWFLSHYIKGGRKGQKFQTIPPYEF